MRVLRFLWSGVLAFDRIGSRIPQLVQIWLVEFLFVLPLTFFLGKVIDIRGCCGVEGTGESLDGVFYGALLVSLVAGFFVLRSIFRPRLVEGEWAPVTTATIGHVGIAVANRRWAVSYKFLTSHPSYVLLLLLTFPIPLVMVWATQNHGDDVFYWRASGWVGLGILGLLAVLRLVSWYVVRAGRREVEQAANEQGYSTRRLGWEVAWKPVLMLFVLIYGFAAATLGVMFWNQHRTIENLPVATLDAENGSYVRVVGTVVNEPVYWAPRGGGRGGNNYSGAGVVVRLDQGGEVLLLAESLSVPDFKGDLDGVHAGDRVTTQGKVVDEVSGEQVERYGWEPDDLPEPSDDGRVLVLHSYP